MAWADDADTDRINASLDRLRADLQKGGRMDFRDIAIRAAKTFVQVLITAFPVSAALSLDIPALKIAALSAGAAAAAVVWNAVLQWTRR